MSTNKTPNYQLHRWTLQDDFLLQEINENFTGLDAALAQGLAAQVSALAQAVQQLETKITQGDTAQASALTTKFSAANSSINSVSSRLNNLLVFGTYQGDGESSKSISLGFTPRALLFHTESGEGAYGGAQGCGGLVLPDLPLRETYDGYHDIMAEIVTGGFTVYRSTYWSNSRNYSTYTNLSNRHYYYLAIR